MIPRKTLKKMVADRLIDAKILLNNRRNMASIYIAGYALEMALKYRISRLMKFNKGFPESKAEFNSYYLNTKKVLLRATINELKDIRHHQLPRLLFYSGEQIHILTYFEAAWDDVKTWDPAMRYTDPVIRKQTAVNFLANTRTIVNEIL